MWWDKYIRIPFKEKGRDEVGTDCWGLVRLVYARELGVTLNSAAEDYTNCVDGKDVAAAIEKNKEVWHEISEREVRPFDVVLARMAGFPMHVGIVTTPGFMLHCSRDTNTTHEDYRRLRWKPRIEGFYRYGN